MKRLIDFNNEELSGALKLTQLLANQTAPERDTANAEFLSMSDDEILDDAEMRGKALAARRNKGIGGRILIDTDDEETQAIRKQVKDHLRSKGFYKNEKSVKD